MLNTPNKAEQMLEVAVDDFMQLVEAVTVSKSSVRLIVTPPVFLTVEYVDGLAPTWSPNARQRILEFVLAWSLAACVVRTETPLTDTTFDCPVVEIRGGMLKASKASNRFERWNQHEAMGHLGRTFMGDMNPVEPGTVFCPWPKVAPTGRPA